MTRPAVSAGSDLRAVLRDVRGEVRFDEPLARYTSMKIGGPADALAAPVDEEDLRTVVCAARAAKVPVMVLGGTNIVVRDGGVAGIVLRLAALNAIRPAGPDRLYAEAGAPFPALAHAAKDAGLAGLEFACGIPGTVGGAIVMNAGTQDGEIANVLQNVRLMTLKGDVVEIPKSGLSFRYRGSSLPPGILLGCTVALAPDSSSEIEARMHAILAYRRETQPLHLPNAGCIFKNPPGASAGRMIDELGLKGRKVGGVQVSERHGNFMVNTGGGTARDLTALIREVGGAVERERGVTLELEVKIVGRP
ncbi:MAG: UDP-N-acetylmuramate dehydrogenase [Nitrospiria bacterium]